MATGEASFGAVMPCPQRPCQRGSCREGPQASMSASITCKKRPRVCHLSPRNFPKRFKASKTPHVGASGRNQGAGGCPRTERVQAAPLKAPLSKPESPGLCFSHGRGEAGAVCAGSRPGDSSRAGGIWDSENPFQGPHLRRFQLGRSPCRGFAWAGFRLSAPEAALSPVWGELGTGDGQRTASTVLWGTKPSSFAAAPLEKAG